MREIFEEDLHITLYILISSILELLFFVKHINKIILICLNLYEVNLFIFLYN